MSVAAQLELRRVVARARGRLEELQAAERGEGPAARELRAGDARAGRDRDAEELRDEGGCLGGVQADVEALYERDGVGAEVRRREA